MRFYAVVERPIVGRVLVSPVLAKAIEDFVAFKKKMFITCVYSLETFNEDQIKSACLKLQKKLGQFDEQGYITYVNKLIMGFKIEEQ